MTNAIIDAVVSHFGFASPFANLFLNEQARFENTTAENNPLACTQPMEGSTVFNDAGVQNYPSEESGIDATILTLDPTTYGGIDYFPTIRRVLQAGVIDAHLRSTLAHEIDTWGTHAFADEIRAGWNPTIDAPAPEPAPTPTPIPAPEPAPLPGYVTMEEFDAWREHFNFAILARFAAVQHGAFDAAANPNAIPAYSYTAGIDAYADVTKRLAALESPAIGDTPPQA